ncbi:MAG: chloride channel protein [Phycisphaerales bacterium]|nr:chloride channel protein [Phycisphaerales bacterium]
MHITLSSRLRRIGTRLHLRRDWYLVLLATLIGLLMACVSTAFIYPLRVVESWGNPLTNEHTLKEGFNTGLLLFVIFAPTVGGLITGWLTCVIVPSLAGPGVPTVLYAIHRRRARLDPRLALRKWLTATSTIASGGSAGAEGPIVTIGSAIGSGIGRLMRIGTQNTTTLIGCAASAGIASVFNAPIAGIFFVMEILLRDFSLRTFTPIVIASVMASALTQYWFGTGALFDPGEALSEVQLGFAMWELPNYLILGCLCGLIASCFIRALVWSEQKFGKAPVPAMLRPAIGGALLSILGVTYILVTTENAEMPPFFGNGYLVIDDVLSHASQVPSLMWKVLGLLLALGALKFIATCLTVGSGGSGGLFAPSLLIGAAIGAGIGILVNLLGLSEIGIPPANPVNYALVGMAAMLAGTTHAPLTAILIVYELTRSYEIILPLMFAAVISTIIGRLLFSESMYSVRLTQRGVRLGRMSDLTLLRRLCVDDVVIPKATTVLIDDTAQTLIELTEQDGTTDFIITDKDGHYRGIVTGDDLRETLVYREAIPLLQVSEIMRRDLPTVDPSETLDVVMAKFARYEVDALAVIGDHEEPLGLLSRAQLMTTYQTALSQD